MERTAWAVEFKEDSPVSYELAVRYALQTPLQVVIDRTNETGEDQWAIRVFDDPSFWMDAKTTKKAAVELCRSMGWRVAASR